MVQNRQTGITQPGRLNVLFFCLASIHPRGTRFVESSDSEILNKLVSKVVANAVPENTKKSRDERWFSKFHIRPRRFASRSNVHLVLSFFIRFLFTKYYPGPVPIPTRGWSGKQFQFAQNVFHTVLTRKSSQNKIYSPIEKYIDVYHLGKCHVSW